MDLELITKRVSVALIPSVSTLRDGSEESHPMWYRNGLVCMNQRVTQRWWRILLNPQISCCRSRKGFLSWGHWRAWSDLDLEGFVGATAEQLSLNTGLDTPKVRRKLGVSPRAEGRMAQVGPGTLFFSSSTPQLRCNPDILNDWDEQNSKQTESKFSYMYP